MVHESFNPDDYLKYRQPQFNSRWLRLQHWQNFINDTRPSNTLFTSEKIGESVKGRELRTWCWGRGDKVLLIWSQMHGNEPTGTMALADLMAFLNEVGGPYRDLRNQWYNSLSIYILPILNPDGAESFNRLNARGVDINRDARKQSTPEMRAFQQFQKRINPDFTFNLHDQRNIFSAGPNRNPATISFLAASADPSREITPVRRRAMSLIGKLHQAIVGEIPGCIGRYSDEFYPRAIGDYLHAEGTACILIESGAAFDDPLRDTARKMNFLALLKALEVLSEHEDDQAGIDDYHSIPENQKLFYDLVLRDCEFQGYDVVKTDLALLIDERIDSKENNICKHYIIKEIGDLNYHFGLIEISNVNIVCEHWPEVDRPAKLQVFKDGKLMFNFKDGISDEEY